MLGITSAKLTAPSGSSGWVQIHEFTPDDQGQLIRRGKLFVILATEKTVNEIDAITSGRAMAGRLHDEYFGMQETGSFDSLRSAVQKTVDGFKEKYGTIEIGACAFVDGVVYSVAIGGPQVIICRDNALATILASGSEVITASGYPKAGDLILLATKSFFGKISQNSIKMALTSGSLSSIADTLNTTIRGEVMSGNLGALIMKFGDVEKFIVSPSPIQNQIQNVENVAEDRLVNQFKPKVTNLINKFLKKIPQKSIYIKSGLGDVVTSQSKKTTLSVGLILLVILIVSIGFGVRQKKINDLKKKYQGVLQIAQDDVDQAIALASVSPDKSREFFLDSELKLKEVLDLKIKDSKVADLQKKIAESKGAILGEYDDTPDLFLDLSLLSSGFTGDTLSSSGGNVFILDKSGKRIVSVAVDTKKSKVVAGPTILDSAVDLASYQDTVFVLATDGIYQVGLGKTKLIDKTWVGEALIYVFAGNMYVLDKSGNQIYRYSGQTGGTFGVQQNWLSASTKPNFAGAINWKMDGSIYVLFPNSKILKYSLGSPQNFSISGVFPEIGNIDAIYADPDNQYIYLLDKAGKRVVVVDKKGKYRAQYIGDQIAGAKNLVVSEAQKEIILLTGDKLLSIGIKHL